MSKYSPCNRRQRVNSLQPLFIGTISDQNASSNDPACRRARPVLSRSLQIALRTHAGLNRHPLFLSSYFLTYLFRSKYNI